MEIEILNQNGSEDSKVLLADGVFNQEFNQDLVHQLVNTYIHNSHQRTKGQKNRSAVRGGGKKPWKQKGTGRARAGTIRSPIWRGGGMTFAHVYSDIKPKKINKKTGINVKAVILGCSGHCIGPKKIRIPIDVNKNKKIPG